MSQLFLEHFISFFFKISRIRALFPLVGKPLLPFHSHSTNILNGPVCARHWAKQENQEWTSSDVTAFLILS